MTTPHEAVAEAIAHKEARAGRMLKVVTGWDEEIATAAIEALRKGADRRKITALIEGLKEGLRADDIWLVDEFVSAILGPPNEAPE